MPPPRSADGRPRCAWCLGSAAYIRYHDEEWGVPTHDDGTLFELLLLEGAQAGLSWSTILAKREGYRRAFDGFDAERIARYRPAKLAALMRDPGIVRNRLKIEAAVQNAKAYLHLREGGESLDRFVWKFVDGAPRRNRWRTLADVPASTPESDALSRALKQAGFRFVGSTICYAFMQAVGMVNDHVTACFRHREVDAPPRARSGGVRAGSVKRP